MRATVYLIRYYHAETHAVIGLDGKLSQEEADHEAARVVARLQGRAYAGIEVVA